MQIFCMMCNKDSEVRLTDGSEIYPHRTDLYSLPFWKCVCGGFVGCHHKTKERTKPLGIIPDAAMKEKRKRIHSLLDPLWLQKYMTRNEVYQQLSKALGRNYHTAELASMKEANLIIEVIYQLRDLHGLIHFKKDIK